jgi:indolepyruvate ferredoxin oxidoreductase beta subunit
LKPAGTVIINEHTVEPIRIADQRPYPDDAIDFLTGKGFDVVPVPATDIAIELGNHRAANVVLLGALAGKLEIPSEIWEQTIDQRIPERFLSLNRAAFAAGREALRGCIGAA